jgi:sortase A
MKSPSRALRILERLLLWGGALALAVFALGLLHQRLGARIDRAAFARDADPAVAPIRSADDAAPAAPRAALRAEPALPDVLVPDTSSWDPERRRRWLESLLGDPAPRLALLEIPALDVAVAVLDGTDEWTLNRGVGRIPGTSLDGNLGIAGHRDGFFRALERIEPGETLRMTLLDGTAREYEVEWKEVVRPHDVWVLDPTNERSVTLVTCYPFRYVGTAPKRFVVRAVQVARADVLASDASRHARVAP